MNTKITVENLVKFIGFKLNFKKFELYKIKLFTYDFENAFFQSYFENV